MHRRCFLQIILGLGAASLSGCGDSNVLSDTGTEGDGTPERVAVTGAIDAELSIRDPLIGSAFGPTVVKGRQFTTAISAKCVGLLSMQDAAGGVRAFTLTLPGQTPNFSFRGTALAIVFMEPGFLQLDPDLAREQILEIERSAQFPPFLEYLRANFGTPLDVLSGEADYLEALQALTGSLGTPYDPPANPTLSVIAGRARIDNPSPRFLQVRRGGTVLPDLVPPWEDLLVTLAELQQQPTYILEGLGFEVPETDLTVIDQLFPMNAFDAVVLPLFELAAGQPISSVDGLALFNSLDATVPALGDRAFETETLATATGEAAEVYYEAAGEQLSQLLNELSIIITSGSYIEGLGYSIAAVLRLKAHNDNPTRIPYSEQPPFLYLAAALLLLPSVSTPS